MNSYQKSVAAALIAFGVVACGDSSGPDGEMRVYMSSTAGPTAQAVSSGEQYAPSASLMMGDVPVSAVDSIKVVLTSIDAIKAGDSTAAVSLSVQNTAGGSLNLMKLATLGSDSTLLARGDVPAGTYNNIRLRFSSASITLKQTVTVGQQSYAPGTYELTIPSGSSSGIKVQGASITVADGTTASVNLSFDKATSIGNIVATGSNKLMMSPVLHARSHVED